MNRYQEIQNALGSEAILTIISNNDLKAQQILAALWEKISTFENKFSRFKPDSELSQFNKRAGKTVDISPEFRDLLKACISMHKLSDGLFNPFTLPSLQAAGYIGSWPNPEIYNEELDYHDRNQAVDMSLLHLTDLKASIPPNTAIDFGGIGKGYLLDSLSNYLDSITISNYWLSIGGDIICNGADIDDKPWSISIQSVVQSNVPMESVSNSNRKRLGVATSGITKRQGLHNNSAWHHIIDPRTSKPAVSDVLTVTVTAPNATIADVFAKYAVIYGSTASKKLIDDHTVSSLYLQLKDSSTVSFDTNKKGIR
jgi:thiamine biosynthesis lipoprotein